MIDRLKFRGKTVKPFGNIAAGIWVVGTDSKDHIDNWTGWVCSLAEFFKWVEAGEIDPATVSQWTGLKDSKGVEIYEGDMIQYKHYVACERWWSRIEEIPIIKQEFEQQQSNFSTLNSVVRFSDGCFQLNYPLTLKDVVRQQRVENSKGVHSDVESKWWDFEVIGTIHDKEQV